MIIETPVNNFVFDLFLMLSEIIRWAYVKWDIIFTLFMLRYFYEIFSKNIIKKSGEL